MPLECGLDFRLTAALEIIPACAGIEAEPKPLGRTALDLHPCQ